MFLISPCDGRWIGGSPDYRIPSVEEIWWVKTATGTLYVLRGPLPEKYLDCRLSYQERWDCHHLVLYMVRKLSIHNLTSSAVGFWSSVLLLSLVSLAILATVARRWLLEEFNLSCRTGFVGEHLLIYYNFSQSFYIVSSYIFSDWSIYCLHAYCCFDSSCIFFLLIQNI